MVTNQTSNTCSTSYKYRITTTIFHPSSSTGAVVLYDYHRVSYICCQPETRNPQNTKLKASFQHISRIQPTPREFRIRHDTPYTPYSMHYGAGDTIALQLYIYERTGAAIGIVLIMVVRFCVVVCGVWEGSQRTHLGFRGCVRHWHPFFLVECATRVFGRNVRHTQYERLLLLLLLLQHTRCLGTCPHDPGNGSRRQFPLHERPIAVSRNSTSSWQSLCHA
jgi:hypothetical protein